MATIDYTPTPACRKCGGSFFRRQRHGDKGPLYFIPYELLTCEKCGYQFRMRLGGKRYRDKPVFSEAHKEA